MYYIFYSFGIQCLVPIIFHTSQIQPSRPSFSSSIRLTASYFIHLQTLAFLYIVPKMLEDFYAKQKYVLLSLYQYNVVWF